MNKETSKLVEQIFKELSQKVLNEQSEQQLVDQLFGNFSKVSRTHNIRIIEEDDEEEMLIKQKIQNQNDLKRQAVPQANQQKQKDLDILRNPKNLSSIHLRHMVFSFLKRQCKKIEQFKYNYSHQETLKKAKNLLFQFFSHYCQIFEEMQLKPQAERLEKQLTKLFVSNSIQIISTLFRKGFRKLVSLSKCILKLMFVGNNINRQTLTRIGNQIKVLIGVRVQQLLIDHEKLAYEYAFKLKGMAFPIDFDIHKVKEKQKQQNLNKKKKKQQQYQKIKTGLINMASKTNSRRHVGNHFAPNIKLEEQSPNRNQSIDTRHAGPRKPLSASLSINNKVPPKLNGNGYVSQNFNNSINKVKLQDKSSSSSVHNQVNPKTFDLKNTKKEQPISKKPTYRVVETILLQDDEEEHKTNHTPVIEAPKVQKNLQYQETSRKFNSDIVQKMKNKIKMLSQNDSRKIIKNQTFF